MLSLAATENRIEELIKELLISPLSQPAFALNVTPSSLDDRAINARQVANVIVRFKKIDYEPTSAINPRSKCFSQINSVYFEIVVNSNNLRTHIEVYAIAQAIIAKLRGQSILIAAAGNFIQSSPAEVSSFVYENYDTDKACNKATIFLMSKFTDQYLNNAK